MRITGLNGCVDHHSDVCWHFLFFLYRFWLLFCLHLFGFDCFVHYLKVPPLWRDSFQLPSAVSEPPSHPTQSIQSGHNGPVASPSCSSYPHYSHPSSESSSSGPLGRGSTSTQCPVSKAKTQPFNIQARGGGSVSPAAEQPATQSVRVVAPHRQTSQSPLQPQPQPQPGRHVSCLSVRVNARPRVGPLKQPHEPSPSAQPLLQLQRPQPVVPWASSRPPLPCTRAHVVLEIFEPLWD